MHLHSFLFPPPSRSLPFGEMQPMEISTLTLVLALVSGLTGVASANQHPFNLTLSPDSEISRSSTGILRRFSDPGTPDVVLGAAQVFRGQSFHSAVVSFLFFHRLLKC